MLNHEKESTFTKNYSIYKDRVDSYIANLFQKLPENPHKQKLVKSMLYACSPGGKRFRPVLTLVTAETLSLPEEKVLPFAAAIELIHSYSLIHDDLPCLDNDDLRRGQPSNHKVYGEALALLSGNALMNMAFEIVTQLEPPQTRKAIEVLVKTIGIGGMLGGQAIDIQIEDEELTKDEMKTLHWNKTGALIEAAVSGPAYIFSCAPKILSILNNYGKHLGLAFQIADDLLDKEQKGVNYVHRFGEKEAKKELESLTRSAILSLEPLGPKAEPLKNIAEYNHNRII